MSRTWTLEQIEKHMRQQTSSYLKEFIYMMDDLDKYIEKNYTGTDPVEHDNKVVELAISILKERGEWNA